MRYFSSTTPHHTVSSNNLFYFKTAMSDSREQSADRIFRPSSRKMFERCDRHVCIPEDTVKTASCKMCCLFWLSVLYNYTYKNCTFK